MCTRDQLLLKTAITIPGLLEQRFDCGIPQLWDTLFLIERNSKNSTTESRTACETMWLLIFCIHTAAAQMEKCLAMQRTSAGSKGVASVVGMWNLYVPQPAPVRIPGGSSRPKHFSLPPGLYLRASRIRPFERSLLCMVHGTPSSMAYA